MEKKKIKIKVTYKEGYQNRYIEACLMVLENREKKEKAEESITA